MRLSRPLTSPLPATITRLLSPTYGPGTRYFAWVMGLIAIAEGLVLVILPSQFSEQAYDALRPHLALYGAGLIAAGLLLLCWQILPSNQRWLPAISFLLAAAVLVLSVQGFVRSQSWNAAATYGLEVGLLLVAAVGLERFRHQHLDLLTLYVASGRTLLGLLLLFYPAQWGAPVYRFITPQLGAWGLASVAVGVMLFIRVAFRSRAWSRFLGLSAAAIILWWAYELAFRTNTLTALIANGGFAIGVAVEPFLPVRYLMPPRGRLRAKLIAGVTLVTGVTLLLLVFLVLQQTDAAYEHRAGHDLTVATEIAADDVHEFLVAQERTAILLSRIPPVQTMDPAIVAPILRQMAATDSSITLAGVSDASGIAIASSLDSLPPASPAQPPGVARILQTHEPAIEVAQAPRLGTPALFVRSPIFGADGTFLGFYSSVVSLQRLNQELGALRLGDGGRVIIIDDEGRVVVHPDATLISERANVSGLPPVASARQGKPSTQVYRDGDTLWLSAQTTVPGLGWTVLAEEPRAAVLAPATLARERAFGFLCVVLLLAFALMTAFAVTLSRPLGELALAASRLGKGSFDAPLPAAGEDEVGRLVSAFAQMRANLREQALDRQRIEAALRASEERFRTIVETALEGIYTTNAQHQITFANAKAVEMMGYTPAEFNGLPLLTLVPERQREAAAASLGRRQYGFAEVLEVPVRKRDGSEIWGRISSSPMVDDEGNYNGTIAMVTDITGHRQRARERERLLEAERVTRTELAERTAALEAKTADQDAFLYTVSHDLKAPLVSILGMAELLTQDAAPRLREGEQFYLTRIVDNAQQLAVLLEDLLTLSRAGRVDTMGEPVALDAVMADIQEQLAVQISSRQADLVIDTALPVVLGNRGRLAEVFMNLVDNAIKYTPLDRTPAIHLGARVSDRTAECWVEDNGVGIAVGQRQRVFGLFTRLPDGKRLHANGSGAGLAIVARIIEVHGGKIWIEDSAMGSRFVFTLPLVEAIAGGVEVGGKIGAHSSG